MLDRLSFVEGKYEELTMRISDPSVIADQENWQKLVKEHSDLEAIVMRYREFRGLKEELDSNMEMLQTEDDLEKSKRSLKPSSLSFRLCFFRRIPMMIRTFSLKSAEVRVVTRPLCFPIVSTECIVNMLKARDGKLKS